MRSRFAASLLRLALITSIFFVSGSSFSQMASKKGRASVDELPIQFEPNYGQAEPTSRFVAHLPASELVLHSREFDLYVGGGSSHYDAFAVRFVNASEKTRLTGSDLRASRTNYLLGRDPSRWHTHIPNFGRVTYAGLYPGIDAVFHGTGQRLEHDFVVSPGADYHAIRMHLAGSQSIALQTDGQLRIRLAGGDVFFAQPEVYQLVGKVRHKLGGTFAIVGRNEITFQVGPYDHSKPLVIDPVLVYSTFLANYSIGMSAVAADSSGSAYLTGATSWSGFPVTPGAFDTTCEACPNGNSVFVSKLTPDGTGLVYSTFLGGSGGAAPTGIAVDSNGNAIVVGNAVGTGFPLKNPIAYGYADYAVNFGFITSLSADGASLNYSSILGGAAQAGQSSGTAVDAIVLDGNGTAYITGSTDSPVFPVTAGAYNQGTPAYPETIVFVTKFLSDGSLAYSSLLGQIFPTGGVGGEGPVGVSGIAIDATGGAYITGTAGTTWPTTLGAYQTQIPGASPYAAPFVTKLAADASSLTYSTFIGASGQGSGIAVDAHDEAIVVGSVAPSTFPTTSNAYQPSIPSGACCPSYLSKVSADGSQLLYSTFFYGNLGFPSTASTAIVGVALDTAGDIWVAGNTNDVQLPLQQPIQSVPGPIESPSNGGFLSQFDPTGTKLMFSTYLGGPFGGLALTAPVIDGQGKLHVAGTANYQLYTSPGVYLASVTATQGFAYGFSTTIDPSVASPAMCVAYPANQELGFPGVPAGSSSSLTLKITNCGTQSLSMSSFQSSSPIFTVPGTLNGCAQQVAVNASCTLTVTFAPATFNTSYAAVLTISGNISMPLIMPLFGSGLPGLGLSAPGSSGTATVTAGGTATYRVSIGGEGIGGTATLTCENAPANAVCSLPGTATVSATSAATLSITVSTAARTTAAVSVSQQSFPWLWTSALLGVGVLVSMSRGPGRSQLRRSMPWQSMPGQITAIIVIAAAALLLSCGSGSSGSPGPGGTPQGTYTLTLTATAGTASQSLPLILTVQ
jgi:hypothetical protein